MANLGFMSKSVVAKSVPSTSNSSLPDPRPVSSALFPCSPFLKFPDSTTSMIHGPQCTTSARVPVQAVMMERDFQASASPSMQEAFQAATLKNCTTNEAVCSEMTPLHKLRQGGFPEDDPQIYRQIFVIRSYEVGHDKSTSIREIFSLFQEVALNHVQLLGIAGDGLGATRGMNRRGLIWVVTKMQVHVTRYPSWPEVIEIDSWVAHAGKNGMRRDWILRSYRTGTVLARATSTWCMMNGTTRRLSKIPDEVRDEIEPAFVSNRSAFRESEGATAATTTRIVKLDEGSTEHQSSKHKSTPADLDMNQHVSNLKYINWALESVPEEHMETHKLASIALEYRRECHSTDIVESLTGSKTIIHDGIDDDDNDCQEEQNLELLMRGESASPSCCQYTHLLRTQDAGQLEILRGKTTWRSIPLK